MDPGLQQWRDGGRLFDLAGQRLFVRRGGAGTAVLALHGYPSSSWDFSRVWSALSARHDVIAPDGVGFGFSSKPVDWAYSVSALADLHEALLHSLGVSQVHVVAFDLGTAVAQELLARHHARVASVHLRSVCFLNGSLFPEVYRPRLIQRVLASPLGGLVGPRLPKRAVLRAIASVFGPASPPSDELLEQLWALLQEGHGLRVAHRLNRLIFERRLHRERWVGAMQATTVPLRLVNGPADPNSGAHMAARYQALVPSPDVVVLGEGVGHWPLFEAPAQAAAAVLDFFARVDAHARP